MKFLGAGLREVIELFADDGTFAAAIVGWIAVCAALAATGARIGCLALPAGLIAILVFSAYRATITRG